VRHREQDAFYLNVMPAKIDVNIVFELGVKEVPVAHWVKRRLCSRSCAHDLAPITPCTRVRLAQSGGSP
jgi:hypothetical protein